MSITPDSDKILLTINKNTRKNKVINVVSSTIRKVAAQVHRMNCISSSFCLTGGLCECDYIREALSSELGIEVISSPRARYAGAIGAALSAVKLRK